MKFLRQTIYTGEPAERVLLVTGDINGDGNDEIVIGGRVGPEGAYWLVREAGRWRVHLIDDQYERLEAGGVLFDIDGDGRLDLVAGSDYKGDAILWWRQPADPTTPWTRHEICRMPATQSHDQLIADLDGDGRAELYFWNQRSNTLFAVNVPPDPTVSPWPGVRPVVTGMPNREEGLTAADVDGDGRPELIAGLSWYKAQGDGTYARHEYARGYVSPRVAAADFDGDGLVEIVVSEGDASFAKPGLGRLALFHQTSDPTELWRETVLHEQLEDPHSLFVADFDGDGRPDLFVGECGDPQGNHKHTPAQRVYFNRGGQLVEQIIDEGVGTHEAKAIRLDGRVGIAGKPYRSLKASSRDGEADCVHLWLPEA